ncbi:MAG TPA: hypothetical protein VNB94_08660 [Mycobacteriales bacterium]|nr:hypothetical protein [Mycobacteriales bacterium]
MDDSARIAALEAQVAALAARLDRPGSPVAVVSDAEALPLDRRAMLRRGGAVLAGLAAAPLLLAEPAAAATGDSLVLGSTTNTATNGDVTRLSAANAGKPVLEVSNTDAGAAAAAAQPVLRLTSASAARPIAATVGDRGDLAIADEIFLNFAHTGAASGDRDVLWGNVFTSQFANFIEILPQPQRILDTRDGTGRLGSTLKRPGGSETIVDVSGLVVEGLAVFGNLTVTGPDGSGFLATYPGVRPNPLTSSINYVRGQTVANFALVGLTGDAFKIFTSQQTHIVFDAVGFLVFDVGQVDTAAVAGSPAARAALRTRLTSR